MVRSGGLRRGWVVLGPRVSRAGRIRPAEQLAGRLGWRLVGAAILVVGVVLIATAMGSWAWLLGWGLAPWGLAGIREG